MGPALLVCALVELAVPQFPSDHNGGAVVIGHFPAAWPGGSRAVDNVARLVTVKKMGVRHRGLLLPRFLWAPVVVLYDGPISFHVSAMQRQGLLTFSPRASLIPSASGRSPVIRIGCAALEAGREANFSRREACSQCPDIVWLRSALRLEARRCPLDRWVLR